MVEVFCISRPPYRAPHLNIYRVEFWVAKMTQWHLYRLLYDVSTILRSYILKVQPTQSKLKRTAPILKIQLTNKHQPNSPKFKPYLKIGSAVENKDPSINIVYPCHKTPTWCKNRVKSSSTRRETQNTAGKKTKGIERQGKKIGQTIVERERNASRGVETSHSGN